MSFVEIDSVRLAAPDTDVLHGRNVDAPKPGQRLESGNLRLVGWVLAKTETAVAVEVVADGHVIARAPVDAERPDLALAFPGVEGAGRGGFRVPLPMISAEPSVDLQVRAVLQSQRRVNLGTVRVRGVAPPTHARRPRDEVSVVIPCFNQAHYLADALASVAAQTHGRADVVVVDDGSNDNTVEVADRFPGVRYVRQDNAGLAAARNTGIRLARSDRLVFLDADDRLLPSALEVGLAALEACRGDAFVFGTWRLIGADGSVLPTTAQAPLDEPPYRALLRMCFISTPAAVMYRRSAVETAGGFDTTVSPSADYDLYLRITRTRPVFGHGQLVAEYRRHGANMTLDRGKMLASELTVLRRQWPYVRRHPELRGPYRDGLRRSRSYHGDRLAHEARALAATRRWEPAARGTVRLLRYHPAALLPLPPRVADAASDVGSRVRSLLVRPGGADQLEIAEYEVGPGDEATWER